MYTDHPPKKDVTFSRLLQEHRLKGNRHNTFLTRTKIHAIIGVLVFALLGTGLTAALVSPYTLASVGSSDAALDWWEKLPHSLDAIRSPARTVLLDNKGKKYATLFNEDRVNVKLARISPHVLNALVATEDARFYDHNGLDPKGILRAFINNLFNDSVEGASTITQQLVENLRIQAAGDDPKLIQEARGSSVRGKLEEVRYAQGIEADHDKKEILEAYLNVVYFGNKAYGIEAAAQRYFSIHAKSLNVPQAATLIAMLKSPTYYDPIAYPEASRLRRDVVMKRMVTENYLPEDTYYKYIKKKTKLKIKHTKNGCGDSKYPYYCQLVVNTFLKDPKFGKTSKERKKLWQLGGYTIKTPLDRRTMKIAQKSVDAALGRKNRVAAATASIIPGKGKVAAIAQNRTWGAPKKGAFNKTEIIYANTPQFQVGSTFKPITSAAALEEGFPASTRLDSSSPKHFADLDEPAGGFRNDDRRGHGNINMATALRYSINTYFVTLTDQVGVQDVAAMARRLGMKSVPSNLTGREGSITLGSYASDSIELATVYAALAGRGVACSPVVMNSVVITYEKKKLPHPNGNCHQEISPAVADTMAKLLQAPFKTGGTAQALKLNGRKATGKTGTTDNSAATWFAGYTPQLATAVWVGDPRGGNRYPLDGVYAYGNYYNTVFGGTIAGPIWKRIMNEYHAKLPALWFPKPGGVSASLTSRAVPSVKGISLDAAVTTLLKSGFKVKLDRKTAAPNPLLNMKNYVVKQSPKSGSTAVYGDTVTLKLTAGSETNIVIPDTLGELKEETKARSSAPEPRGVSQ